jgi:hypothetical protein
VLDEATRVLHELEGGSSGAGSRLAGLLDREQYSLFAAEPEEEISIVRRRLSELDPERLTPLEALMALVELKRLADREPGPEDPPA